MWNLLKYIARQNHASFHSITYITPKSRQFFVNKKENSTFAQEKLIMVKWHKLI